MSVQNRVPSGVPTGGQWAEGASGEPDLSHLGGFFETMAPHGDTGTAYPPDSRRQGVIVLDTDAIARLRADTMFPPDTVEQGDRPAPPAAFELTAPVAPHTEEP